MGKLRVAKKATHYLPNHFLYPGLLKASAACVRNPWWERTCQGGRNVVAAHMPVGRERTSDSDHWQPENLVRCSRMDVPCGELHPWPECLETLYLQHLWGLQRLLMPATRSHSTCHYPPSDDFRHDILRMTWVGELCPCGQLRWQHPRPVKRVQLEDVQGLQRWHWSCFWMDQDSRVQEEEAPGADSSWAQMSNLDLP